MVALRELDTMADVVLELAKELLRFGSKRTNIHLVNPTSACEMGFFWGGWGCRLGFLPSSLLRSSSPSRNPRSVQVWIYSRGTRAGRPLHSLLR
ncbi:hypothetical protein Sjap_004019 [Stephania japonica]|uniref:Uncharacterized protein n=1 Tax=Stephania japonica TaxID=461633 RepID=A0AAP0PKH7_9MAGN